MRTVLGAFSIDSSHGATVILEGRSNLPMGKKLRAEIRIPGRAIIETTAYKDWPYPRPVAYEGYFLTGIERADLIDGTAINVELLSNERPREFPE